MNKDLMKIATITSFSMFLFGTACSREDSEGTGAVTASAPQNIPVAPGLSFSTNEGDALFPVKACVLENPLRHSVYFVGRPAEVANLSQGDEMSLFRGEGARSGVPHAFSRMHEAYGASFKGATATGHCGQLPAGYQCYKAEERNAPGFCTGTVASKGAKWLGRFTDLNAVSRR